MTVPVTSLEAVFSWATVLRRVLQGKLVPDEAPQREASIYRRLMEGTILPRIGKQAPSRSDAWGRELAGNWACTHWGQWGSASRHNVAAVCHWGGRKRQRSRHAHPCLWKLALKTSGYQLTSKILEGQLESVHPFSVYCELREGLWPCPSRFLPVLGCCHPVLV